MNTILRWVRDNDQSSSILWLYGPAGAGKSAIAQTVAEHCAKDRRLASSFFFSRNGRTDGKKLFLTIAYQLAISVPQTRKPIGDLVKKDLSILAKSMDVQLRELIVGPYQTITSINLSPMIVIIDGVDECEGSQVQRDILTLIGNTLTMHQLPLRFFVASRPEPHIRDTMDSAIFRHISRRLVLDESFWPGRDIQTFLQSGFAAIHTKHHHVMASVPKPWPSPGIIDLLVQKSSGQFIYASTVLKYIDDEYSRPTARLDTVLGLSGSNSTAFAELDLLYMQILSTNPNTASLLHVLATIVTLSHPLPARDIEKLLFLQRGDVALALRGVHSLLHIPNPITDASSPILTLHASLSDFLGDKSRSKHFFIDFAAHHAHLACCCLKTMTGSGSGNASMYVLLGTV